MITSARSYTLPLLFSVCCLCAPRAGTSAVFLIGIDGADSVLTAELVKAGRMPNLAGLIKNGALGELYTFSPRPLSSPVIWTSMVTGKSVSKHGITAFTKPNREGWFQSGDRKAPALWNMVSSLKKTVAVTGFLITYPAEAVNGIMVSNNYAVSIDTQHVTWPPEFFETSRNYTFRKSNGLKEAAAIAGYSSTELLSFSPPIDSFASENFQQHYIFEKLVAYARSDNNLALLNEELLKKDKFDLFITYFPGIDQVSHMAWGRYEAAKTGAAVAFGDLVPSYYAQADKLIGILLARTEKNDTIIVVSDHGFQLSAGATSTSVITGDHRQGGIFVAKGPDIKRGIRLKKPIIDWDIAPTVLQLMGLPLARDFDGKNVDEMLTKKRLSSGPEKYIDSYQLMPSTGTAQDIPLMQQEMMERLKLSGYVQ
ncbi:MAG: hypothetical protein A2234_05730 [Elusimicrobia bacterium RIFOXYA2_FULL_58_8]|nr:MAG: hypothetical protein A2285_02450 [Elusimicrobia bacterium RIFOXYA12_FULL_57_11]OGS13808.1 MAG: hypothetical protein A2234_05730 [Elusimicrobia bacterium RIFOXYA2_FULL_58_8]